MKDHCCNINQIKVRLIKKSYTVRLCKDTKNKLKKILISRRMKAIEEGLEKEGTSKRAQKHLDISKTWIPTLKDSRFLNTTN